MYELREGRKMRPKTFAAMLSNLLYERRFGPFFVEPIVAGIDPATKEPYICNMDLIGNKTDPEDFVVGGTSDDQLYGMLAAGFETEFILSVMSDNYLISNFKACAKLCGPRTWIPIRSSSRLLRRSLTHSIATPVQDGAPLFTSSRRTRLRRESSRPEWTEGLHQLLKIFLPSWKWKWLGL